MRNKKHSFIYSLSFAIATASMLFTANASAELSGRSVKIGLMVPLTGKGAEWGEAAIMG